MIKLIFKTLWARRKRNAWVLLELTIVSLLMWLMIDQVVVNTYMKNHYPGYDLDLLFTVDLDEYKSPNPKYDESQDNGETRAENVLRILDRLRQVDGVEAATVVNSSLSFNSNGAAMSNVSCADTLLPQAMFYLIDFYPQTDFFRTYGIKGKDGVTLYEEPEALNGGCLITPTAVKAIFPDESPIGKYLFQKGSGAQKVKEENPDRYVKGTVADVIADITVRTNTPRSLACLTQGNMANARGIFNFMLVVRKDKNISDRQLLHNLNAALPDLKSGMVFARNPLSYSVRTNWITYDLDTMNIISYAVMIFFLVNICLALIATFYMQTRSRSRDAGIMRAYGFRKGTLVWLMIAEGWALTFIAWILGTAIFFIAGGKDYMVTDQGNGNVEFFKIFNPMWYDNLFTHSAVIGGLSLLIMLAIVTIGIWLPARRIAASNPVDTLKDY